MGLDSGFYCHYNNENWYETASCPGDFSFVSLSLSDVLRGVFGILRERGLVAPTKNKFYSLVYYCADVVWDGVCCFGATKS